MKKVITVLVVFLLSWAGMAQPIDVKSYHPRVLIDSSTIDLLEARALANTPEWQELQVRISAVDSYSSEEIMDIVYEGQHYAFMYALSYYASGNISHRDSAVSLFQEYFNGYTSDSSMYYDSGYESRSTMVEVSLLYDWLYNYLPEPFRSNVRARLILWADWILTQPGIYGIWYGPYYDPGNNYTMGHFTGITHVGFAIHSEDAVNGDKFIQKADSIRPYLMNFANTRLGGGDANEGWGYGAGYAVNYFKALAVFKTATVDGIDHFSNTTYDEDVMKFLPMATLPDLEHMLPEGDWARESTGELWDYNRIGADLVSSYSNDPETRRIATFWGEETVPFSNFAVTAYRWYPFLFSNQEEPPLDYRTIPFYQQNFIYTDTSGTDQFIRRTGWASDDLWVSYRAGGRYGDHAHNGSGHFSIYKNGWLLIDNNILTSSGIEGYDSMHNCMHIEHMNNFEMYPFNDYENAEHSLGVRRDFTADYSYLWTNSAPIYLNRSSVFNNVEVNQRQFFFIPEIGKLVIYDLVETTSPSDHKWFGLNYLSAPTLSADSSFSYLTNSQSRAAVYTTYPLNTSVLKYGNSVRVRNQTLQAQDHFVHLVAVSPVTAGPLTIVPMNIDNGRIVESNFYGSYHKDVIKDYVILFASQDNSFSYDSVVYDFPLTNEIVHNYLIGLEPSTDYYVSSELVSGNIRLHVSVNDHTGASLFTSTAGGILSFELTEYAGLNEDQLEHDNLNVYYQRDLRNIVIESYLEDMTNTKVEIYSIAGELISSDYFSASVNRIELSMPLIAEGIYIITVRNGEKNMGTYKLVIN
jgi:hypothetical protein